MPRRSAYHAIMMAAEKGTGCRLTADEVFQMSRDHAISEKVKMWDDAPECSSCRDTGFAGAWVDGQGDPCEKCGVGKELARRLNTRGDGAAEERETP